MVVTITQSQSLPTVRWLAEVNDLELVRSCWSQKYQIWTGNSHHFSRAINKMKGAEAVNGNTVTAACYRCLTAMPASVAAVRCPGCRGKMIVHVGGL